MSKFISLTDYDASIHNEILDAVTRYDDGIVEICEDRAITQMRSYLKGRYDVDAIFSASGTARNQLILMTAIDGAPELPDSTRTDASIMSSNPKRTQHI